MEQKWDDNVVFDDQGVMAQEFQHCFDIHLIVAGIKDLQPEGGYLEDKRQHVKPTSMVGRWLVMLRRKQGLGQDLGIIRDVCEMHEYSDGREDMPMFLFGLQMRQCSDGGFESAR